ncbi:PorP/SprF family type IX secretion system membrane protein [uncultured Croceitalea sp.]|uniref:PorP/SprF family type IX secretion system membrane protein n=1 Tax=uncultured Croceitalea sp. TaxID=1798908 RepID=UPI003305F1A2
MRRIIVISFILLFGCKLFGQEVVLPSDFRQHSLTQFNSSLLNPSYTLDWNNPRALSLWTRWQWQTVDGDPTSLFLNYSHTINSSTAIGLGFLQHNTGTFLNTGGVLNFAQSFSLQPNMNLIIGANIYLFTQELADDRFNTGSDVSDLAGTSNFIGQFSPGIRLNINNFNIGASLENSVHYNFSQSEMNENSKVFVGTISNDFPIVLFPSIDNNFVRPVLYIKSIPDYDIQYGGNVLLSTSKFWVQGGYNSFYGPSGGIGATLFGEFSIGGLVEFGTGTELDNEDPTFELVASYHFGKGDMRKKVVGFEVEEEIEEIPEEKLKDQKEKKVDKRKDAKKKKSRKEIKAAAKAQEEQNRIEADAAEKESRRKILEQEVTKRRMDSIAIVKEKEAAIFRERNRLDSIASLEQTKEVEVLPNEKYEEVTSTTIEGLAPGFYLIANVFGTEKYFNAFMKSMKDKGLEPKSFYRTQNNYNYVYLAKYNTIEEARKARNSNLNGKYQEKTWIFRVRK